MKVGLKKESKKEIFALLLPFSGTTGGSSVMAPRGKEAFSAWRPRAHTMPSWS